MEELYNIASFIDNWKFESLLIKILIFCTATMGTLIAVLIQSTSTKVRKFSQFLSVSVTIITGANFFFYNFDYKSLDFWITKIETKREEIRIQYIANLDNNGNFLSEEIRQKFHKG